MFGDGLYSWIIFKSTRLSRVVILTNEYVNICKYFRNTNLFMQHRFDCAIFDVVNSHRNVIYLVMLNIEAYYYFSIQTKC